LRKNLPQLWPFVQPAWTGGYTLELGEISEEAEEQDSFVVVVRGEADLKRFAVYSGPDQACALLIDSRGEVRWRGHGSCGSRLCGSLGCGKTTRPSM